MHASSCVFLALFSCKALQDTHPGELLGNQPVHHRGMHVSTTDFTEIIMHAPDNLEITLLQINCVIEPRNAAVAVRLAEDVLLT